MNIKEIETTLKKIGFKKEENYWNIELPIILKHTNACINVRAFMDQDELFFTDDGGLFFEIDEDPDIILRNFLKQNNYFVKSKKGYEIKISNSYLIKKVNFSALYLELSNFIKCMIALDNY